MMSGIVCACAGRFHIYDQAAALHGRGRLRRIISMYPDWFARRHGIPRGSHGGLWGWGLIHRGMAAMAAWRGEAGRLRDAHRFHAGYGRAVARTLPVDMDAFIGLSSFALEGLRAARRRGALAVVDHGSLHQAHERRVLLEEHAAALLPGRPAAPPRWIIDREQEEFRAADGILTLSSAARRSVAASGIAADRIAAVTPGIDLGRFTPTGPRRGAGPMRIVFCGRIDVRKGIHRLIPAFAAAGLADAELVLIGGADDAGRRLLAGLPGGVRWLGPLPQEQLAAAFTAADLLVLPSIADGFGLVVAQAMACGCPVAVSDQAGAADLVEHGRSGFVFPGRDTGALVEILRMAQRRRSDLPGMGEAARTAVAVRCSRAAYADRLLDALAGFRRRRDGQDRVP